ncbi:TPA: DUF551 domain-containing protein [Klebsiella pneumoniae subsp. pneumoniae]|nr:DUF551 domain-containing protein [Klebsiella pneumoniae subsp. pneumoniae]
MTKSTITRERLEQLADNNTICKVSWDERIELAQIALAAMDSEPVALKPELAKVIYHFRDWNEGFPVERFKADYVISWMLANYPPAQPAPVVPEEATPDSIGILASARRRDHAVFQWDEDQRNAAADSWNACRAAMLEADPQLPGSDSAPVPGSWIPVSERMPERGDYLVTDGCDFDVQLFNGEQFIPGFVWEDKITHWMPLPAAPQEVNHG